jgi:uncharacterized protein with GYD domain
MSRYIIEGVLSPQSSAGLVKNPHDRAEALQPLFKKLGCKLEAYYFAVGQAKHYAIIESPKPIDPVILEAMVVANVASGATTSISITPVLTSAEMVEAFSKVSELGYKPPSA